MASRFDFTSFTEKAKEANTAITLAAEELEIQLDALPKSREQALALTKLEEAIMWACKALRTV